MKMFRSWALALALLAMPGLALSQTQPSPIALDTKSKPIDPTPTALFVAPAGGAAGKGTVVAPDHPLPITCPDGSCGGGGGGAGAVFGPEAAGVAAAHPPILLGGTLDGTATGTVQNAKLDVAGNVAVSVSNAFSLEATQLAVKADLDSLAGALSSAIPTGANTIGNVGLIAGSAKFGQVAIDQTTPGTTNAVQLTAGASGGATPFGLQSAATTNSTSVKGSAGTLKAMNLLNTTTTVYYLRMYDSASAPTCSSATNFVRSWPVPPAASSGLVGGVAAHLPPEGTQFSNGIAFCLTGGPTSTDNTNAATGVFVNLDYK